MTPEHRNARDRVRASIKVWKRLEPPGWDITHLFIEGKTDTQSPDVMAETDCHWEYHQAVIRWSLPAVAGRDTKYIDGTLVHELIHCYLGGLESHLRTDDYEKWAQNLLCEHAVDHIARAILRVAL